MEEASMEKFPNNNASKNKRFKRKKIIIILILVLTLVVISALIYQNKKSTQSTLKPQVVIMVTASGFQPETVTVPSGSEVVWKNVDVSPHRIAINPYPVAENAELDSGVIVPGSSYTFMATEPKTISYHDETNPEFNATLVVEQ